MKKNKNDRILIGVLLIIFGGYLLITSVLEKKGEVAYVKVDNELMFSVDLKDGTFKPRPNEVVKILQEMPVVEEDKLLVDGVIQTFLAFNQGIVRFENLYYIMGNLGIVVIEYKDNQIRVKEEISPYNICSRQGFSDKQPIICLPNYVTIEFNAAETDVNI